LIDELYLEMTPAQLLKAQDLALERFNKIKTRKAQNRYTPASGEMPAT